MNRYSTKEKAIFNAALDLIQERGFHGTPVSAVADKAEVATGTIYHYFEGKEQLLQELFNYSRQQLIEIIVKASAEKCNSKEKFESIWNALYNFYITHPQMLIFFEQYSNSPFSKNKQTQSLKSGPLKDFINKCKKEGVLKTLPTDILLIQIISSCVSYAKLHLFSQHRLNKEDINNIIEMTWDAISQTNKVVSQ